MVRARPKVLPMGFEPMPLKPGMVLVEEEKVEEMVEVVLEVVVVLVVMMEEEQVLDEVKVVVW